jgi:hypothetical protein
MARLMPVGYVTSPKSARRSGSSRAWRPPPVLDAVTQNDRGIGVSGLPVSRGTKGKLTPRRSRIPAPVVNNGRHEGDSDDDEEEGEDG